MAGIVIPSDAASRATNVTRPILSTFGNIFVMKIQLYEQVRLAMVNGANGVAAADLAASVNMTTDQLNSFLSLLKAEIIADAPFAGQTVTFATDDTIMPATIALPGS